MGSIIIKLNLKLIRERLKLFRGFEFQALQICANPMDGYGLTLFELKLYWLGKACYSSSSAWLFSFLVIKHRQNKGEKLRFYIGMPFFSYVAEKILIPQKPKCDWCHELCDGNVILYLGPKPYCCEMCSEFASDEERINSE